jgi:hypothetical protein
VLIQVATERKELYSADTISGNKISAVTHLNYTFGNMIEKKIILLIEYLNGLVNWENTEHWLMTNSFFLQQQRKTISIILDEV